MKITNVIWLTQFVRKIEGKHGVSMDEVEQVFASQPPTRLVERGKISGENLYQVVGQTDAGHYLTIFFIYKGRNRALVISARDADAKERRNYGKHKK